MSIIEAEEGLIAFDTGDTKHDGELMLKAIRTVSRKPIKVIIYGHSRTVAGAAALAEGNDDVVVIGHPGLNQVVERNLAGGGAPAFYPELAPYLTARAITQFNGRAGRRPHASAGAARRRAVLLAMGLPVVAAAGRLLRVRTVEPVGLDPRIALVALAFALAGCYAGVVAHRIASRLTTSG